MAAQRISFSVLLLISLLSPKQVACNGQWDSDVDENGKAVQSLKIEAPAMTEEDQYGYNMPDRYQCDSCKAVMYHLDQAFARRQPKSRRLQEWEYEEIFEETCRSGFKGYGIKLVNGQNALSGPALQHAELQPGMGAIQMGGQTWEKRLGEICRKLVYDKIGEDALYEHFRSEGKLSQDLCFRETRDCQSVQKPSVAASTKERKAKTASTLKKEKSYKKRTEAKEETAKLQKRSEQVAQAEAAASAEAVDAGSFLAQLAVKHGVAVEEYTKKRDCKQWEQLLVKAAGRIFEHSGSHDKDLLL